MLKNIVKVGLVFGLMFSGLSESSENDIRLIDVYQYIVLKECVAKLDNPIKFGSYSSLTLEKCERNNKVTFNVEVNLDKPYSFSQGIHNWVNAFGNEVNIPGKKLIEDGMCEISTMPKGLTCMYKYTDVTIMAAIYEGVEWGNVYFIGN